METETFTVLERRPVDEEYWKTNGSGEAELFDTGIEVELPVGEAFASSAQAMVGIRNGRMMGKEAVDCAEFSKFKVYSYEEEATLTGTDTFFVKSDQVLEYLMEV